MQCSSISKRPLIFVGSPSLRLFILLETAACKWRGVWSIDGMIAIEEERSTRRKVCPISTVSKSVTCTDLGLKLCSRRGRPAINSLRNCHFIAYILNMFISELMPYLAESTWFLSYQEQPVDSVQENNICWLWAVYQIYNYINAEFISAKMWYIWLTLFSKRLKRFMSLVVAVKPLQAVQNARSDVRTGAVCQSMNSATPWWCAETAAMSLEKPARRAPGGGLDTAHFGVLMGAVDPMPSSAPGETAVEMDQTKRTVLSAVRAFSYPFSALTESPWSMLLSRRWL
jgi:hypothetical protein